MLAYQWQAESGIPVVFLHGLLGSTDDWQNVFQLLQNFPEIRPLAIDLPYHGQSANIQCNDFATARQLLSQTLSTVIGSQPFYLVGYSLGGRIALDYLCNVNNPNLKGVILEGANVGLTSKTEQIARLENDTKWAKRFESEILETVLNDWYQQPVFANLSESKRYEFVQKRQNNHGKNIAKMLLATSLAKQSLLIPANSCHYRFLIGEKDQKFRKMAESYQLNYQLIPNAGHNTHQANPQAFVEHLIRFIKEK